MSVTPYLFFDGRCEEAIDFYRQTFGAEVTYLMRFSESPEQCMDTSIAGDKVMHGSLRIGGTEIMVSDGNCQGRPTFQGISLAHTVPSDDEAERLFALLSEAGQVQMPMTKTFFSSRFGMVADRFGVSWMILTQE